MGIMHFRKTHNHTLTFRRNHLSVAANLSEWRPEGENDLLSYRFKAWYQGSLLLWKHNRNACMCTRVCAYVSVCPGGLFDDQFPEFAISVCLRFKERETRG